MSDNVFRTNTLFSAMVQHSDQDPESGDEFLPLLLLCDFGQRLPLASVITAGSHVRTL